MKYIFILPVNILKILSALKNFGTIILFFLILSFFNANSAFPQTRQFGAGIIIGEPTGISLKYWLSGESALDLALAWSFSGDDSFHLHGDYLIHNFGLIQIPKGRLPLYYGIGARYRSHEEKHRRNDNRHSENIFGVRVPVGLAYLFADITLDIFLEIVPVVNLIPDTDFNLDFALGARYFF